MMDSMNDFLDDADGYALATLCMHELVCDNYKSLPDDIGIYSWRDMSKVLGCVVLQVDNHIGEMRKDMCWYNDLGYDAFDFEYCAACFEWFTDGDGASNLTRLINAVAYAPSQRDQAIADATLALRQYFLDRLEGNDNGEV